MSNLEETIRYIMHVTLVSSTDKSKPDVSSIMKTQAKSDLIENLLTSPVKKDDIKTFVGVNGSPENG